jgi:FdhD protein
MTEVHVHGPHATVRSQDFEDEVAVEEPLEIRVDGAPLAVTMRTPGHDDELALGFPFGEGLIDEPRTAAPPADLAANTVEVAGPLLRAVGARSFYTSSSCGVCGKGAPVLVGVGAPTSLAVRLADDRGITLCGFARDGRMNVYTGAERVR